jgi:glycosyltransferase involved in cell wall biosynthesis
MKFLVIASYPDSLINFRGDLIDLLCDHGIQVHIVCPDLNVNVFDRFANKNVFFHDIPLQRTGLNVFSDFFVFFSLRKLMLDLRPDVVFAYTIKPIVYGILSASLVNVPKKIALVTGLGYAFSHSDNGFRAVVRKVVRFLFKFALSRAELVFFQNPDDLCLCFDSSLASTKSQLRIINGSGVNISYYSPVSIPDRPVFLLVARLLGDKGVREFVEAARLVKNKYPSAQFDLVGWVDENPDAIPKQELDTWCNEGIINYKGRLSDVRSAIASCTVFVLPSYREGTPRSVLEAMAMGRPIITTDAPGCRETVVDGDNGFLVPVKSAELLATSMLKFIEHPELISRMGKRSRQISEEKYDVNKVNQYMLTEMGVK